MADATRNGGFAQPTIFLSAGEPSGDIHGANLIRALRARLPRARFLGLGGPRMAGAGMELLAPASDLAVIGFAEVVTRLPFFLALRRRVFAAIERERVDLVIPIDYPGFNLRLARRARRLGIPVLYYIAPQVWAWHPSRARNLARHANEVAVILPFEAEVLRRAGARARFVGHPLLDLAAEYPTREEWAAQWQLEAGRPILALFPGSRAQEIHRHLQLFSEAAARVVAARPDVQPVIGTPPDLDPALYADAQWPLVDSASGLLQFAEAALVKSGTGTLEAALVGTPLVVAYRMHAVSYQLARRLIRVPHISLTNLVAGREIAPEFVQNAATPAALSEVLLRLLDRTSDERRQMVAALARVRHSLGESGVADRVAEMAGQLIGA